VRLFLRMCRPAAWLCSRLPGSQSPRQFREFYPAWLRFEQAVNDARTRLDGRL